MYQRNLHIAFHKNYLIRALTAVLAHLAVLQTPALPEPTRQNSLNLIHQETQRINRLVQSLLELSRLETTAELELRPIDLLLVTEAAIADIILTAKDRNIQISLQAETGLARVLADPDKLKQVLLNILDNAVKYGRSGDKVDVQLQKRPCASSCQRCRTPRSKGLLKDPFKPDFIRRGLISYCKWIKKNSFQAENLPRSSR